MKYYLFGNTKIGIDYGSVHLVSTEHVDLFETDSDKVDLIYHFIYSNFDFMDGFELIEYTPGYEIYNSKHGYFMLFHWGSLQYAFGYFIQDIIDFSIVDVYVHSLINEQHPLYYDDIFGNLSLHIRFLRKSMVVLHCSYICYHNEAILFLGKSGMGKSTQADLWEKYADVRIINGDRALVGKINGKWYAFGYPANGSSKICENVTLPIKAFVILRKADYNNVEQIPVSQKVMSLVAGMAVYPWMKDEMNLLFNLCTQIVQENKIFKLNCTISEEAVKVVQKELEE